MSSQRFSGYIFILIYIHSLFHFTYFNCLKRTKARDQERSKKCKILKKGKHFLVHFLYGTLFDYSLNFAPEKGFVSYISYISISKLTNVRKIGREGVI